MPRKVKKIYYNKLIRDKIPEKIRERSSDFKVYRLNAAEFEKELLKKVGEEASALPKIKSKKQLLSELADILAVIDEIKKLKRITAVDLKNARKENFEEKGGFKKRLFLIWSSDDGYRTNERRNARQARH